MQCLIRIRPLLMRAAGAALLSTPLMACKMINHSVDDLPRNQSLPFFNPHVADFVCRVETSNVPPIDAQAQSWFLEARALEEPGQIKLPDYERIVQLTRRAAERHHWKAMLNLASYYLEQRDPPHGTEDAVKLVEQAMRLGIPAAFDRMGTYYMNGTGVRADATRAYAFWQRAAEMGNPQAMSFLGDKISGYEDSPAEGFWANKPIALKMMECAFGQGYGDVAFNLSMEYTVHQGRTATRDEKARALKVLHDGVRLGCEKCAVRLYIQFDSPYDPDEMLPPHVDKARAERYQILADALGRNPYRKFPNLDKVLPLPPADLPPWNGDRDTLLAAAMGLTLTPKAPPKSSDASKRDGRYFLDSSYDLSRTAIKTTESRAPFSGYWRPTGPDQAARCRAVLEHSSPGLYQRGEAFDSFYAPPEEGRGAIRDIVWEHWRTIRHDQGSVNPQAAAGLTNIVARPEQLVFSPATVPCPIDGIWQPWILEEHPMHSLVNLYWRQAWLVAGQPFPSPQRDWMLDIPEQYLTWHLLDATAVRINS
jgi:hypothetical protein